MAYVRVPAGGGVTSDDAQLRSDDQSGVAVVAVVPQGFVEIDQATYATEKAAVLSFNRSYVPPKPTVTDPDEELMSAIENATTLAELKLALRGMKSKGRVKARPI